MVAGGRWSVVGGWEVPRAVASGSVRTTDYRPPTTDPRPPTTDHRPPTTDHRPLPPLRHELIPNAVNRDDVMRVAGNFLDLVSQFGYVHIDGARKRKAAITPDRIKQLVT